MKYSVHLLMTTLALCCMYMFSIAQEGTDTSSPHISSRYVTAVTEKSLKIERRLERKTEKVLSRFEKQRARLKRKIHSIDSSDAINAFTKGEQQLRDFKAPLDNPHQFTGYIPLLDTLKTSLKFLDRHKDLLSDGKVGSSRLNESLVRINSLEQQFQKAEDAGKFLKQQKDLLKEELQKLGLSKQLKRINKDVYYYSEQVKEYKALVNDKRKVERKAIELLSKTKLFQEFMKKNSALASLFRMPVDDPNDPAYLQSLSGLQTRSQVNQLIQQQIATGGPNALQDVKNNIAQAQNQLQQLKDKMMTKAGSGSSDDELPRFRPNGQKTKTFIQRLEVGTNTQSQKGTAFLPVTSDIGVSIGYKVNDRSIIGVGASYKIGWGKSFRQISITHQGAGLRSFVDYNLKKMFWISGGYEMNYRSAFNKVEELKNLNAWQQSGLIGFSKKVSVNMKILKSTKVQLLWDFLSYQQVPRTQPIVFRVGYSFTSSK